MGSPIVLAALSMSGREASRGDPATIAKKIRSTLSQFTSERLAAHLHEKMYEASPQRIWQAFQGRRHIIATSWVGTGVHKLDFGQGKAMYVEAVMPSCDGCVQVMESPPLCVREDEKDGLEWWKDGVDLSVHLEKKAMERLLEDRWLRKYENQLNEVA